MTHDPEYILLDRYLAGECSVAEGERVRRWLAADPSRAELVDWMRDLGDAARELPEPWNASALWAGVEARIAATTDATPARPFDVSAVAAPKRRLTRVLRIAAVIALALGGVALWRITSRRDGVPAPVVAARSFTTRAGERAVFTLADGSRVTLGASSRLDVAERYGARGRDVYLQGQAYFEVVPNPDRPFSVHSGMATTRVLGTKFDVRAYREDSTVTVVVAEGTVAVTPKAGGQDGVVLERGDFARVDVGGHARVERGVDVARYVSWTQGRLEFVNAPLRDVLPELARWYDLDFRLADSALADRPLTASLGTESGAEMLQLLEASLDVRTERNGRTITLRPQR